MADGQVPGIGEDVSHLMGGGASAVPGIGEDVSHLMDGGSDTGLMTRRPGQVPAKKDPYAGKVPEDFAQTDTGSPAMPTTGGMLRNMLTRLWSGAKANFLPAASPQVPADPSQVKLTLENPFAGLGDALSDPLKTMYDIGPLETGLGIAGAAELGAGAVRGVHSAATRRMSTIRGLQAIPEAPGTVFGVGTDLADAATKAPEQARLKGVKAYQDIKDSRLGDVFVPDQPESPAQAKLRLKRAQLKTEARPSTPSADALAEVKARQSKAAAARGLPAPPDISLSSVTPEQWKGQAGANIASDIEAPTAPAGPPVPHNEWRKLPADPEYFYHATNAENAADIAQHGIQLHDPAFGTEQDMWPDGSTEPRAYFTDKPSTAYSFAPENGRPVLLKVRRTAAAFKREPTGDFYVTKEIPPNQIEVVTKEPLPAPPTAGAPPAKNITKISQAGDQTVQDIRQGAKPGFPTRTGPATVEAPVSRAGTPPTYQQELSRIGQTPEPLPDAPKGQSLRQSLDEKSSMGRRETGLPGPKPATRELAQAHQAAERRLIRAVENAGEDPTPLLRARDQYAKARQLGRATQPIRGKAAGSLVDMFADPRQLATAAQKVRVYEPGSAPRVQNVKEWYGSIKDAVPDELDAVMRHAEAKVIDSVVDVQAKTLDGQKLQGILKAYEDQGIKLPHHDEIAKFAKTAVEHGYRHDPTLMKNLRAAAIRWGAGVVGGGGAGYALYHWARKLE